MKINADSSISKYEMMIERIQGQIQGVNVKKQVIKEDRKLSPDEKKEKIKKLNEQLEKHQAELGRTKSARTAETLFNKGGVIVELSAAARILNSKNETPDEQTGRIRASDESEREMEPE